ncbi:ABC transporter ATP-binding protein [Parafannyhessea umbonata]|uniref:ABC transporter ATP-binding protein n=1 Tax=Parafannyhessea umbonata TaxID=604330 RepID=UPI002A7F1359|nr:ABC transporter ATP-binding protein [Parafannyhessea umbonata]MDY4418622.1 ABC transporter ATP-binding protein [Parafannyhessea umbonata]
MSETTDIAIEYRDVTKAYGEKTVLSHFDLRVPKGEFLTIVGSSGCGKTTALKMVNRLIEPTSGDVLVGGRNVRDVDAIELRRSIGYAIQGSVLFPHMTVEENVSYVPHLLNKRDRARTERAVSKWMDIVGLPQDMLDRYPAELSGGQQQRVGIARALAASPDTLLMDEPFGAVDEITRGQLQTEIARIHRECGITIMFVTHDIGEALRLGTRVLVLDAGRIQQYGTPQEILARPATEFVERLVARQRHACDLSDERLCACEHSGAARAEAALLAQGADKGE